MNRRRRFGVERLERLITLAVISPFEVCLSLSIVVMISSCFGVEAVGDVKSQRLISNSLVGRGFYIVELVSQQN